MWVGGGKSEWTPRHRRVFAVWANGDQEETIISLTAV